MDQLLSGLTIPPMSRTKVYIIDEAHMLTNEAEALLLKPLEEPPANTVFIMTTTAVQKIKPTIQSRLVKARVQPLTEDCAIGYLRDIIDAGKLDFPDGRWEITGSDIVQMFRNVGGSPRDLLSELERYVFTGMDLGDMSEVDQLIQLIVSGDELGVLDYMAEHKDVGGSDSIRVIADALLEKARQMRLTGIAPKIWSCVTALPSVATMPRSASTLMCATLADEFHRRQQGEQ